MSEVPVQSEFLAFLIDEFQSAGIPIPKECNNAQWVVTYQSMTSDVEIIVRPNMPHHAAERKIAAKLLAIDKAMKPTNSKDYRAAIASALQRYEAHIAPK